MTEKQKIINLINFLIKIQKYQKKLKERFELNYSSQRNKFKNL